MHVAGQYPLKSMRATGICDVRKTACVAAAIVRIQTQLPFLGTLTAEGICCVRDKLVKVDGCQVGRETLLLLPWPCCGFVEGVCSATLCLGFLLPRLQGQWCWDGWCCGYGGAGGVGAASLPPPHPLPLAPSISLCSDSMDRVVHGRVVSRGSPVHLSGEVAKARL